MSGGNTNRIRNSKLPGRVGNRKQAIHLFASHEFLNSPPVQSLGNQKPEWVADIRSAEGEGILRYPLSGKLILAKVVSIKH